MRQRHAGDHGPPGVVGAEHGGPDVAAQREEVLATGEARAGAAAPERERAAARLAVEREARPAQELVAAPDADAAEAATEAAGSRAPEASRRQSAAEATEAADSGAPEAGRRSKGRPDRRQGRTRRPAGRQDRVRRCRPHPAARHDRGPRCPRHPAGGRGRNRAPCCGRCGGRRSNRRSRLARGAFTRSSTCSTTWTAAVRLNRAMRAFGSGSLFSIVPVAVESLRVPFDAFDSASVSVSPPSSCESSRTVTSTVAEALPAAGGQRARNAIDPAGPTLHSFSSIQDGPSVDWSPRFSRSVVVMCRLLLRRQ